jgi:Apea-like HEPN
MMLYLRRSVQSSVHHWANTNFIKWIVLTLIATMPYSLVIPILNDEIILLKGPLFTIADNIIIEKLSDEEHSAFFRYEENIEIRPYLAINETKCLKITLDDEPNEEQVNLETTKLNFLLNIFATDSPIIFQWTGVLEGTTKLNVKRVQEFDAIASLHEFCSKKFKVRRGITRQSIIELYKRLSASINTDNGVGFTIRRFNSSLLRLDFYDRLIDSTICLESLISGTTELSFRFSLFLSLITKDASVERSECYERLKDLYDVRSKIVHGEIERSTLAKIEAIKETWIYYHEILRSAILYYLIYMSDHNRKQWRDHLLNIILGSENKISI